jgi:hypothetical protein
MLAFPRAVRIYLGQRKVSDFLVVCMLRELHLSTLVSHHYIIREELHGKCFNNRTKGNDRFRCMSHGQSSNKVASQPLKNYIETKIKLNKKKPKQLATAWIIQTKV